MITSNQQRGLRTVMSLREALDRITAELLSRPELPPPRPVADVFETPDGDAYVVEVPAPGLSPEEISLSASGDLLTLEINPRVSPDAGRTYLIQEVSRQPAARVFSFPTPVDTDRITARLEHGMLHIEVPKAEGIPSRIIPVQTSTES